MLVKKSLRNLFSTTEIDYSNAQKYIKQNLRSRDWSTYILTSHYPKSLRTAFCTLHLFDLQLIKISDNMRQPSLALGRFEFWKDSITKIYNSQASNNQPISICLNHSCHHNPLTKGYFTRMIETRSQQISKRNFETMQQLIRLAEGSVGPLIALKLQLLRIQIDNENMQKVITLLSRSIGICSYIKRIPYGLRTYRYFVPLNIMSKYNLNPRNVWDRIHGKPSEDFFDVILEIAAFAKKSFEEAKKIYKENPLSFPKESFRAFLQGVQTQLYLQLLERYNFNIFDKGLHSPNPFKLPYRLFQCARNRTFYTQ